MQFFHSSFSNIFGADLDLNERKKTLVVIFSVFLLRPLSGSNFIKNCSRHDFQSSYENLDLLIMAGLVSLPVIKIGCFQENVLALFEVFTS